MLQLEKYFLYLHCLADVGQLHIVDESVSLLSLKENLANSIKHKDRDTRIICLVVCGIVLCPTYIIQVWGIAMFICAWVMLEPSFG